MDIVDAQVHANMLGTEVTLAIMDALGVQGVLFDEYQRTDGDGAAQPGYRLADGTYRPIGPNAESAALRHATVGTILGTTLHARCCTTCPSANVLHGPSPAKPRY